MSFQFADLEDGRREKGDPIVNGIGGDGLGYWDNLGNYNEGEGAVGGRKERDSFGYGLEEINLGTGIWGEIPSFFYDNAGLNDTNGNNNDNEILHVYMYRYS